MQCKSFLSYLTLADFNVLKNNYFTDNFDDENEQALLDKYKNETRNLTDVIQEIKKEVSLKEEEKSQAKLPLPSDLAKFSS